MLRRSRFLRPLCAALALLLAAPPPTLARSRQDLSAKVAGKVFRAVYKALDGITRVASRSRRVDLEQTAAHLDSSHRMRFWVEGTIRVPVPHEGRRRRLQEAMEQREARSFVAEGPLGFDLKLLPIERQGNEFTFEVRLMVMIITDVLLQAIVRNAGGLLIGLGIGALAEHAVTALASMDVELAGGAIRLGVEELPAALGGEAGAIAYARFHEKEHRSWKQRLKSVLSPGGLVKHFLLALVFLGGAKLIKAGVTTVAGTALAALLPAGGPFVVGLAATGVWMLLGHRLVKALTIQAPLHWRLGRIHRLWRKSHEPGRDPDDRRRLLGKVEGLNNKLLEQVLEETERAYKPFDRVKLLTGYFRKRAGDGRDMRAYEPLIEGVIRRLTQLARDGQGDVGWYPQRFLDALREATQWTVGSSPRRSAR